MPTYLVQPNSNSASVADGAESVVVEADSTADAKAMAKAVRNWGSDAVWDGATVTELTTTTDAEGIELAVTLNGDAFSYTGQPGDTMDDLGAGIVAEINAHASYSGLTYTTSTNVVDIPGTNNLGDKTITATLRVSDTDLATAKPTIDATSLTGDPRTITLAADNALPHVTNRVHVA